MEWETLEWVEIKCVFESTGDFESDSLKASFIRAELVLDLDDRNNIKGKTA